jgi:hypothetical protein
MAHSRGGALARIGALVLIALAVAAVVPMLTAARGNPAALPPTYLPSFEGPRQRAPFAADRIPDLQRLQPGYVVIGDSMAGTRVDERRLVELTGVQVAPLLQPGSGSAFWYLALKNWVIASGIRPRMVLIFFRDANLTDVMFRLDDQFRWALDLAALDREDALDAVVARRLGPLHRLRHAVEGATRAEQVRRQIEPALTAWPAERMMSSRRRQAEFMTGMNQRLGLDHLRKMDAADIQIGDDDELFDFARDVDDSVLPLMLEEARRAGLTICFLRVQRRPTANRPPPQSPALRRYVDDLRAYVTARGAIFHDETGDPALTLDMYEDGDHLARHARQLYTENLYNRLRPHFQ